MKIIIKFNSEQHRTEFLNHTADKREDIFIRVRSLPVLPHAVVHIATDEQEAWIRQTIGDTGKVFNDVEFSCFG